MRAHWVDHKPPRTIRDGGLRSGPMHPHAWVPWKPPILSYFSANLRPYICRCDCSPRYSPFNRAHGKTTVQRRRSGATYGKTNVPERSRHKYWRCIVVCANADRATHNNQGDFGDKKLTGTHGTSALARSRPLQRSSRPTESTGPEAWTHGLSRSTEDSTRKSHKTYRDHEAAMPVLESRISVRDSGLNHSASIENQKPS